VQRDSLIDEQKETLRAKDREIELLRQYLSEVRGVDQRKDAETCRCWISTIVSNIKIHAGNISDNAASLQELCMRNVKSILMEGWLK
jgi:hypothetical protein